MARVLYDGLVEFEDGTPATTSQMAKDVTTFLAWASEPELDQRKKMGMQASIILTGLLAMSIWVKKFKWAGIKSRKLVCELFTSFLSPSSIRSRPLGLLLGSITPMPFGD